MEKLSPLITRFINSRRYLSMRSVEYYQNCLCGLLWFSEDRGWPPPASLSREHLSDFLNYVATEEHRWDGNGRRPTRKVASPATVYHYGKVLKFFFTWAKEEEYLTQNPAARLPLPRPRYRQVEPYSNQEVKAMLDTLEQDTQNHPPYLGIRNLAIISLFVDTGLRLSELANMKLSDLDPRLNQARIMGKGAKLRVVPLNGQARKALKRYLTSARQPGGDELWKTDSGEPLSWCSIKVMVNRLKRRAGVRGGGGPHRFRHYFATHCLDNGLDLNTVRLLLGHATLNMVLRYSAYVDVQQALLSHSQSSPLDTLYKGNSGMGDGWGWRH
ncbi:Tyrosine recombinase XerC [subsurface metagenome]